MLWEPQGQTLYLGFFGALDNHLLAPCWIRGACGLVQDLGEDLKIPHPPRTFAHILLDPMHAQETCAFLLGPRPSSLIHIDQGG